MNRHLAAFIVLCLPFCVSAQTIEPTVGELAARLQEVEAARDTLLQVLALVGVSGLLGAAGAGWKIYQAARARAEELLQQVGGDLLKVAERERLREASLNREIVLVGDVAPLAMWRQLLPRFRRIRCGSYDELDTIDASASIVAVVMAPMAGEVDQAGRKRFEPATARMEAWLRVCGLSRPHCVMVQGGTLPAETFASYNAANVYISQAPIRLQGDLLAIALE